VRTRSTRATKVAANRYLNSVQTIRHIQYLLPPTVSAYRSWVLQNSRPVNIEEIAARSENEADTKLLWLGEWKEGGKVLLFLHGGGYVMPLIKQYLDLLIWATEEPVAVLEYTNSPHERYPHQLKQAATAFAHLLERGVKPENVCPPPLEFEAVLGSSNYLDCNCGR
jgi:acetyl esterase/lipase